MKQSIVALCVKQALFIKTCTLKLMIDIGGQHKIILALYATTKAQDSVSCVLVDTEGDYLTCDENGFAQTKDMPYGIYTVH